MNMQVMTGNQMMGGPMSMPPVGGGGAYYQGNMNMVMNSGGGGGINMGMGPPGMYQSR